MAFFSSFFFRGLDTTAGFVLQLNPFVVVWLLRHEPPKDCLSSPRQPNNYLLTPVSSRVHAVRPRALHAAAEPRIVPLIVAPVLGTSSGAQITRDATTRPTSFATAHQRVKPEQSKPQEALTVLPRKAVVGLVAHNPRIYDRVPTGVLPPQGCLEPVLSWRRTIGLAISFFESNSRYNM